MTVNALFWQDNGCLTAFTFPSWDVNRLLFLQSERELPVLVVLMCITLTKERVVNNAGEGDLLNISTHIFSAKESSAGNVNEQLMNNFHKC